jgi:hypothetical protein
MAALPLSCSLHIHSDSQAAIAGIRAYGREINSRKRLRMAGRPLLQLVHRQLQQRAAAVGAAAPNIHSVGNRLADCKAITTRARCRLA